MGTCLNNFTSVSSLLSEAFMVLALSKAHMKDKYMISITEMKLNPRKRPKSPPTVPTKVISVIFSSRTYRLT